MIIGVDSQTPWAQFFAKSDAQPEKLSLDALASLQRDDVVLTVEHRWVTYDHSKPGRHYLYAPVTVRHDISAETLLALTQPPAPQQDSALVLPAVEHWIRRPCGRNDLVEEVQGSFAVPLPYPVDGIGYYRTPNTPSLFDSGLGRVTHTRSAVWFFTGDDIAQYDTVSRHIVDQYLEQGKPDSASWSRLANEAVARPENRLNGFPDYMLARVRQPVIRVA